MRAISLGTLCNNACIFCAQGDLRANESGPRPVAEEIARIVQGEIVAFQGGEPTLFEELVGWIRDADARGARRIIVQTNGRRLAYRAYARALRDASLRLVLDVSLHGATEPMHDYHTQTPGSFRQTVIGVRHARAEGIEVGVTAVITRSNYRHLLEIVSLARGAGATAVHLAGAERQGSAARASDRVLPPSELVRPHWARAVAEAERLGVAWLAGNKASSPEVRERFAGLGEVEPATARGTEERPARTRLPVLSGARMTREVAHAPLR
jgi:MoaA/NifB/PqqE/SkfB family radical SAM enzyme